MSGPRILFASEMGGGNGHVMRVLPVAEALRAKGATVTCAMRDIVTARPLMVAGFDVFPAPRILEGLNTTLRAANYAELMIRGGLDRADRTLLVARAWLDYVEMFKPDLIVADFAPGAMLGAMVAGVPRASLGTGFGLPPDFAPMPTFAPWLEAPNGRLHAAESAVLNAVNTALLEHKRPPLARLSQLVNTDCDILCTFRELDHYDDRPGAPNYIGPIFSTRRGVAPPWPSHDGRKIFAYFAGEWPMFSAAVPAFTKIGESALMVVDTPIDPKWMAGNAHFAASAKGVDLTQVLPHASVVVSHAGMGLVSQALLAGVPMVLFPRNPEQVGTAKRIEGLGCGLMLRGLHSEEAIESAVRQAMNDPAIRARAQALAADFRARRADDAPALAAGAIMEYCVKSMG